MGDRGVKKIPGFGARARAQLLAIGWSQKRLAEVIQISRQTRSGIWGSHDTRLLAAHLDFASSAGTLLDALVAADFDETRLARLEWALLPAIDRFTRNPRALHRLLSENPEFFVEVVTVVDRASEEKTEESGGEEESPQDDELSDDDQRRASIGYSLLQSWRRIPGRREEGP